MSEDARHMAWLQEHALDDSVLAQAYESVGAGARSRFKLCIARLHAFWGERPLKEASSRSYPQGFTSVRETHPVSYAFICCPAGYAYPERLLAACLPALLAGVRYILPCIITSAEAVLHSGSQTPAHRGGAGVEGLLAALELAGLEQTVHASEQHVLEGLKLFNTVFGVGRLVVLGDAPLDENFALAAYRMGVPFASCAVNPGEAPLELDAAHAGVWAWPELGPDWYRSSTLRLEKSEDGEAPL